MRGDILAFIRIPLNEFQEIRKFLLAFPGFITSITVDTFDIAAAEAMRTGDIVLMQQCIQKRVICVQCRTSAAYLDCLIQKEPKVAKHFYHSCNSINTTIRSQPSKEPAEIDKDDSNRDIRVSSYSPNYPLASSPFNLPVERDRAGQTQTSPLNLTGERETSVRNQTSQHNLPSYSSSNEPDQTDSMPVSLAVMDRMPPSGRSHGTMSQSRPGALENYDTLGSEGGYTSLAVRQATKISTNQFSDPEALDPRYKRQNGRIFFTKGRVFAMMFPEPRGKNERIPDTEIPDTGPDDSRVAIRGRQEGVIFVHVKRFVVIRTRGGYSVCVPINKYRVDSVGRNKVAEREKKSIAIIYDDREAPPKPIYPGDNGITKLPIAVRMDGEHSLARTSRIHFGKIYSVEWTVKVLGLGQISPESEVVFEHYWRDGLID